jgi:hypothetical protein
MAERVMWWAVRCPSCEAVRLIRPRELGDVAGPQLGQVFCADCRQPVSLEENQVLLYDRDAGESVALDATDHLGA